MRSGFHARSPLCFYSQVLLAGNVPLPIDPRLLKLPLRVGKVLLPRLGPVLDPLQPNLKLLLHRPPIGHLRPPSPVIWRLSSAS